MQYHLSITRPLTLLAIRDSYTRLLFLDFCSAFYKLCWTSWQDLAYVHIYACGLWISEQTGRSCLKTCCPLPSSFTLPSPSSCAPCWLMAAWPSIWTVILKFADDTAMVGLVYHNDSSEDGQEVKGDDCEFSLLPHYTSEELSRWSPALNTCWCTYNGLTWRISLDILKCVGLGISIFGIEHSYFLHCCRREGTVAGGGVHSQNRRVACPPAISDIYISRCRTKVFCVLYDPTLPAHWLPAGGCQASRPKHPLAT